jgi:hypothetical protein
MTLHTIIIEFTDDPNQIDNHGLGTYKTLPNGNKIIKAYMKDGGFYNQAWLISLHELVEMRLTEHHEIAEEVIDAFDRKLVERGGNADEGGNEPNSPYKFEHRFAENIERQLALVLDVDWDNYYENYQI